MRSEQISVGHGRADRQRGTATLTAVMLMGLLALFTAATLSRVTTEVTLMGNDTTNTMAFYAAFAGLEQMSRNFNNVFDSQLRPSSADLARIRAAAPNIENFDFDLNITQTRSGDTQAIEDGPFSGLVSLRAPWRLDSVATYNPTGQQVHLMRTFFNHQIPIFQFGIFYNDDLEAYPGPEFNFGGRVHSNGHIFLAAGNGNNLWFRSRVTAVGEVVRDISRSGKSLSAGDWTGKVWVADATNTFRELKTGNGSVIGGPDTSGSNPNMPDGSVNNSWPTSSAVFGGNLLARQRPLRLPLQIGTEDSPIEIIKRGRDTDTVVLRDSRYYNKPGLRISLSDTQAGLPGGTGGVRLDGAGNGAGGNSGSRANSSDGTRGYEPLAMTDGYRATRFNGNRLYKGPSYNGQPRQTWIKVELVSLNPATLAPEAVDITADFLSLGLTERNNTLGVGDDRAILKMQRYTIPGPPIKVAPGDVNNANTISSPPATLVSDARGVGTLRAYTYNSGSGGFSFVATSRLNSSPTHWRAENAANHNTEGTANGASPGTPPTPFEKEVTIGGSTYRIVPFPVKLYDTREGLYNESMPLTGTNSWASLYTGTLSGASNTDSSSSRVPVMGIMSVIDIDMFNLGRFLNGTWNGRFPTNASLPGNSLSSDDIPDNGGAGWIVYVSDRRGDRDNDGELDMEDIYGPNDGTMQSAEDVNFNGVLEADYTWEARRYHGQIVGGVQVYSIETDVAAVNALSGGEDGLQVYADRYFRRAARIINGAQMTGSVTVGGITATMPGTRNRGFAIASENGVYTLGNLNARGISAVGTPTQPNQYNVEEVPFSVSADAVTILSNNWQDGKSFRNPMRTGTRTGTETFVRTALLSGDSLSSQTISGVPDAGGKDENLNGGVHNFPRFLESWGARLNYCGSLINLFNSRNNNGQFKCCEGNVYGAPARNWVFNTAFLDINRLPPGTPFFQFVQMTGFRQSVRQLQ